MRGTARVRFVFDPSNIQTYWPRPYIGGPRSGQFQNHAFVSVPFPGYTHTTWFDRDGSVLGEIYQHESIVTEDDFGRAIDEWALKMHSPDA